MSISHSILVSSFPHVQILEFYLNLSDKCSTLNANILLSKDQGTYVQILTPYLHDKPTFCDNLIYYLSLVKPRKKNAKLGVVYIQNKIGIFSETVCEANAPL